MFRSRLEGYLKMVAGYEDPELKAKCLSLLPLDRFAEHVEEAESIDHEFGNGDLDTHLIMIEELAIWFKKEFFSWVNSPSCWNCAEASTRAVGMTVPSQNEAKHDASRVELYVCNKCGAEVRFPRYNSPLKLMETRKGRCGEWANAFTCFCRALEIEARFVVDWTDHVWAEVFLPVSRKWIHVDCCECVLDCPALYEKGWGKNLNYVIAISRFGVFDVTRRYVLDWEMTKSRRNEISETALEAMLNDLRQKQIEKISQDETAIAEWSQLPSFEVELEEMMQRKVSGNEALPGRTTGSVEWRRNRSETGSETERPLRISLLRYRRVKTESNAFVVKASGENFPNEVVTNLFDSKPDTKWLDFGAGENGSAWIEICISKKDPPLSLKSYRLRSANDAPERDPFEWEFEGMKENGEWMRIDHQNGVLFSERFQNKTFSLRNLFQSRRFRICFWKIRNQDAANAIQLSELQLISETIPEENNDRRKTEQNC